MRSWFVLAIGLSSGCLRSTAYKCSSSAECGAGGTCELAVGYCSFPDSTCGQRYGDSAGDLANQCVGGSPMVDAGIDAHVSMIDSAMPMIDAPPGTCPGTYAAANGYAGHLYLVINTQSWTSAVTECMGPKTFLADPTEAAAITALDTLVTTGTYWVGIQESGGSFLTVANTPQTFLPWAPGQPSTTGNQHCVEVSATGTDLGLFDLTRCSDQHPAICECDP